MINKVYLASPFSIIHVAYALIGYPCTLTALTYNNDVNGSPEDPVVCGLSVTEIHTSVIRADPAESQPAVVLAGISALRGDSSDALEGETHYFTLNYCVFLQSSFSSLTHTTFCFILYQITSALSLQLRPGQETFSPKFTRRYCAPSSGW